jgi:hypothetical protein
MIPSYRKFIPKLFFVIAVITIPLIIILSSGNAVNQNNSITNSSTIKINALPAFSDIKIGEKSINTLNSDIKIIENTSTSISIEKENFQKEIWDFYSPKGVNSLVNLDPVFLLPLKSVDLQSEYNIKNILDNNIAISEKDGKLFLSPFDLTSIKTPFPIDVSLDKVNNRALKIDSKTFYFPISNILIYNLGDKYQILELAKVLSNINFVAKISDTNLLVSNTNHELYNYNFETKEFKFLTTGVYSMQAYEENNSIYILTDNGIYKVDRGSVVTSDIFQQSKIVFKNQSEGIDKSKYTKQAKNNFAIKYLSNATLLKFNGNLYINQEGIKEWKLIAKNINQFTVADSKVFYLDENYNLLSLDVYEQQFFYIGSFKKDESNEAKLVYSNEWSRVLFYSGNSIQSIYYNKNYIPTIASSPILYNIKNDWLQDNFCYSAIVEKTQFCVRENKLKLYRNVNFLPVL